MAMLAEGKSKTKWVLNPRGSNAVNEMHFGRKMLEKMGWQSGDGLGANKQGVTEPLRVSYKNDVKGIGYKKNQDNEWLKVEDEFSKFLQNLSKSSSTEPLEAASVESLEKKSECSKARLHYYKFTRNKDLSRYSDKDLSCILGQVKNSQPLAVEENSEDGKFCDRGTINSYFEQMAQRSVQNSNDNDWNSSGAEKSSIKAAKKRRKVQENTAPEELHTAFNDEEVIGKSYGLKGDVTSTSEYNSSVEEKTAAKDARKKKESKKRKEISTVVKCTDEFSKLAEASPENHVSVSETIGSGKKSKNKKVLETETSNLSEHQRGATNTSPRKLKKKGKNDQEGKGTKTEQAEAEATVEGYGLSMPETNLSSGGAYDEHERKKNKINWKKTKFDWTDSDSDINERASIRGTRKVKKQKLKCINEITETEAIMTARIISNDTKFSSNGKTKRNKERKKRKCDFSEISRSGRCSESSDDSDNSTGKQSLATKHEISEDIVSSESCSTKLFGERKKKTTKLSEEVPDTSTAKQKPGDGATRKKGRYNSSDNSMEEVQNTNLLSEDLDLGGPEKMKQLDRITDQCSEAKRSGKRKAELAQNTVCITEEMEMNGKKKKLNSKVKEVENEVFGRKKVKFEIHSSCDDSNKTKKISSLVNATELTDELLKAAKSDTSEKLGVPNDVSGEDLGKKRKRKYKKDAAQEEAIEGFDSKKLKLENDDTSLEKVKTKKKKKRSKSSEGTNALFEETDPVTFKNFNSEPDDDCDFNRKKKKEPKINKFPGELAVALLTESIKIKPATVNFENDACDGNSKMKKNRGRDNENLIKLVKEEKFDPVFAEKCNVTNMQSSKESDKKSKLLALLAKTTRDDSDDSDTNSDPVALNCSVFKGSNFEKIPGYCNLKSR